MRKASWKDQDLVIEILAESFESNKSVNYVVKNDRKKSQRIKALMRYAFGTCMDFGEVWLTDKNAACVLYLYSERKKTNIFRDLALVMQAISPVRTFRVARRESIINSHHTREPYIYLWFIGVRQNMQGRGLGTALLELVKEKAREQSKEIFLETSTVRNLPWYKKHGFHIYAEIDFDHTLYLLKK